MVLVAPYGTCLKRLAGSNGLKFSRRATAWGALPLPPAAERQYVRRQTNCTVDLLDSFASWAWARHHNILSWYIRPLFLLPYCYFAFRRSYSGLLLTLVALLSSMFWFPEPANVHPTVVAALEAERQYLQGPWPLWKVALSLVVPLTLAALAFAFWRRSWLWGIVVVNVIAASKVAWTVFVFDSGGFLAHLAPALVGLFLCNLVLVPLYWRHGRATTR